MNGSPGPRAVPVQCARDEFLAGAGFAGHEHREARARQAADRAEHLLHRRRLPEHAWDRRLGALRPASLALRGGAPHERHRLVDVEGLRQVLECAALIGGDRAVEVRVRGHHDHRQRRMPASNDLQQLHARRAGHAHVGDQHVGTARARAPRALHPPPRRTAAAGRPAAARARAPSGSTRRRRPARPQAALLMSILHRQQQREHRASRAGCRTR